MPRYKLRFEADNDDSNPTHHTTDHPLEQGDVLLLENGMHHCVVGLKTGRRDVVAILSKSAQDPEEALLLARQYGHL